ncbi:E3 ubiquitin protein ligase [Endozoicomonas sp. ONNA2]|uniref:E3 ubiquitin protein ligase n=1 Tax=Endozoicomonas sp. ONNA2 TaxID=2828741 RepID=UPI0021493623|nr:E3 ubiquitin protein ligase [Endozoicomonas sp. ONNA2]
MNVSNGVSCSICQDVANCKIVELTCGHSFGRKCMKIWIETSGQKRCLLCSKPLTDGDLQRINHTPLYERLADISTTAIRTFSQHFSEFIVPTVYEHRHLPIGFCGLAVITTILLCIDEGTVKAAHIEAFLDFIWFLTAASGVFCADLVLGSAVGSLGSAVRVPEIFGIAAGIASGALTWGYAYELLAGKYYDPARRNTISCLGGLMTGLNSFSAYGIKPDDL